MPLFFQPSRSLTASSSMRIQQHKSHFDTTLILHNSSVYDLVAPSNTRLSFPMPRALASPSFSSSLCTPSSWDFVVPYSSPLHRSCQPYSSKRLPVVFTLSMDLLFLSPAVNHIVLCILGGGQSYSLVACVLSLSLPLLPV